MRHEFNAAVAIGSMVLTLDINEPDDIQKTIKEVELRALKLYPHAHAQPRCLKILRIDIDEETNKKVTETDVWILE